MASSENTGFFSDRVRLFMAAGLVALTVGVVALFIQNQQLKATSIAYLADKDELNEEIEDLEVRIAQMDNDLQNKDIELEKKDQQVEALNAELEDAKRKIYILSKGGKLSQEEADKYRFQIDQLNYYVRKYQREIDRLKAENEELLAANEELQEGITTRDQQLRDLEQESQLYATRLDAASILKAVEFGYTGSNSRGKESTAVSGGLLRGKSTEKLKICFRILENEVAEVGQRPVYVAIKGPDGRIYTNLEAGSGYFTHNGQEIPYTARVVINYDRTAKDVCASFTPPREGMLQGQHIVTVYSGGYEIGKSTFTVS